MKTETSYPWKWIVGPLMLVYAVLFVLSCMESTDCSWGFGWVLLKELASAQEEFRRTDADGNGISDYLRSDAAGLYALAPNGKPLRFIELSTAQADRRPASPLAEGQTDKNGYWIETLRFRDETKPDPARFAYCTYWEWQSPIQWMFIVDHHGIIYGRRSHVSKRPQFYPEDPIGEGWVPLERAWKLRWKERHGLLWWVRFWNVL